MVHRVVRPGFLVVTLMSALLAGCVGGPSDAPVRGAEEAEVEVLDTARAVSFADVAGDSVDTITGRGEGKAPMLDIVGFGILGETPTKVLLHLDIAELDEAFSGLAVQDGLHRMATYGLCWSADGDGCARSLQLDVMAHDGGAHTEARLESRPSECNDWSWCAWGAEASIAFGAPARITFTVDKAYLDWDDAGADIAYLSASTRSMTGLNVFPAWHPGFTVHTPAYRYHTHGGGISHGETNDAAADESAGFLVTGLPDVPAPPSDAPLVIGAPGLNHGPGGPYSHAEMDILAFDLFEDGTDLVARFIVAEYNGLPDYDFDYSVAVGVSGYVYEIGYRHEGGEAYGYAGRCIMEPCDNGFEVRPVVDIQSGAPAVIDVRTPLEALGPPAPGTATDLFWVMTMVSDVNYYWGDPTQDDLYGDYHSVFMVDSHVGGHPFIFGGGHRAPEDWAMTERHGH